MVPRERSRVLAGDSSSPSRALASARERSRELAGTKQCPVQQFHTGERLWGSSRIPRERSRGTQEAQEVRHKCLRAITRDSYILYYLKSQLLPN